LLDADGQAAHGCELSACPFAEDSEGALSGMRKSGTRLSARIPLYTLEIDHVHERDLECFPIRWNRKAALHFCFIAFLRRTPVSGRLENARGSEHIAKCSRRFLLSRSRDADLDEIRRGEAPTSPLETLRAIVTAHHSSATARAGRFRLSSCIGRSMAARCANGRGS
jgi:hypothetical protein